MDATRAPEAMHRAWRAPADIGPDTVGLAVAHHLDIAVEVGAQHRNPRTTGEGRECLRRGMAVFVALARRDDGDRRLGGTEQPGHCR